MAKLTEEDKYALNLILAGQSGQNARLLVAWLANLLRVSRRRIYQLTKHVRPRGDQ